MKKYRAYIFFMALGFVLLAYLQSRAPKPLDTTPSFSKNDKIPFGSYLLFEFLTDLFPNDQIFVINNPLTSHFADSTQPAASNIIFINFKINFDAFETRKLFEFISNGGQAFVAAERFEGFFADTLNLSTSFVLPSLGDSVVINFSNRSLRNPSGYDFRYQSAATYFTKFDTAKSVILGQSAASKTNFIRLKMGEGALYLSTLPFVFTNYNMLYQNNHEYIFRALSYLPERPTYWDEYYKIRRQQAGTPLRYVLNQPSLRAAYITAMLGLLLFVIFQGRRRQRIIPVIAPPENTSLEFAKTVGRLYLQHGNHKNLAEKKIVHFLEFIRAHYFLKTDEFSEKFYTRLSRKSGVSPDKITRLFNRIQQIQTRDKPPDQSELLQLHQLIEEFYQNEQSING